MQYLCDSTATMVPRTRLNVTLWAMYVLALFK